MKRFIILAAAAFSAALACTAPEWVEEDHGTYRTISQKGSPVIGYNPESGVTILNINGRPFKDLNKNGTLDIYEDWRKPVEKRAEDLASKLSIDEIAGLMMYSSQQNPTSSELTEKVKSILGPNNVRHILLAKIPNARTGAEWSNNVQAFCEATPLGIPANNSTDPRNYTEADAEFNAGSGGDISHWPREVGMAATFDLDVIRSHGEIASTEYRAIGITTALSPQADISAEPRWRRFYGTFSEDPALCRDIAREYCDAFQTTEGSKTGWGVNSVNCMVKHWPGGGAGEGGRDAHFGFGKYAVYPGGRFDLGLIPFVDGAFNLPGKTRMASAVMPYYTIAYGQDPSGNNVGNGFSHYIIQELLRDKYNFGGVVCTDWGIVNDYHAVYIHGGTPWGAEGLSAAEKRLMVFEAGVDQLGGVQDSAPSVEAYRLWCEKYGEESARERFMLSARRLLVNIFNVGVFENPYVDPENAARVVGCEEFMAAGYDAQLKSVVMAKNHGGALPQAARKKVYIPVRHEAAGQTHWGQLIPESNECPIDKELAAKYFDVVETPEEADFAIVYIKSPIGHWGYVRPISPDENRSYNATRSEEMPQAGHYAPISLQWGDYVAEFAREHSIAGGDPMEAVADRAYRGVAEQTSNIDDMFLVQNTKKAMGDKPVITIVATDRPFVPAEIEPFSDALLLAFGVSNQALLDIVNGAFEPYGLLPCQLPANMKTVEEQCEDVPHDMECYVDADGNAYDFAFGLNWSGVISDARVARYAHPDYSIK